MQPNEALGLAAQVAVTLAGFASVVVVFRPASVHQWSSVDKFRLRLLLNNSVLPLAYSLFGILLLTIEPPPASIWRWCSGFAAAAQIAFAISNVIITRRFSTGEFEAMSKALFYPLFAIGIVTIILQFVNVAIWNRFWPFFTGIFVHLLAAMLQFLRLVLLPPHTHGKNE